MPFKPLEAMKETQLYDIFRKIISKSKRIKRFVVAPNKGAELNKNNLGEILYDALGGIDDGEKYPVALLFPPVELPNYAMGWSTFRCSMYFMDQQWTEERAQADPNPFSNLSQKKVEENWEEMATCAKGFKMVLTMLTDENLSKGIRVNDDYNDQLNRYSYIGNDVSAGVGLTFTVDLFKDCIVSDYDQNDISGIEI